MITEMRPDWRKRASLKSLSLDPVELFHRGSILAEKRNKSNVVIYNLSLRL